MCIQTCKYELNLSIHFIKFSFAAPALNIFNCFVFFYSSTLYHSAALLRIPLLIKQLLMYFSHRLTFIVHLFLYRRLWLIYVLYFQNEIVITIFLHSVKQRTKILQLIPAQSLTITINIHIILLDTWTFFADETNLRQAIYIID